MNIVEKRAPQDGQFSTVIDGKDVDVRVASVATVFGEKIVMRISRQEPVDDRPVASSASRARRTCTTRR